MADEGFYDNDVTLSEHLEEDQWPRKHHDDELTAKHHALTTECNSYKCHIPKYEVDIAEEDYQYAKLEAELAGIIESIGPLAEAKEAELADLSAQMTELPISLERDHKDRLEKLYNDTEEKSQSLFAASAARDKELSAQLGQDVKQLEAELAEISATRKAEIERVRQQKILRRKSGLKALSSELATLEAAIASMDGQIKQNEVNYKRMSAKMMMVDDEEFDLVTSLQRVQEEHEENQSQLDELRSGLSSKKQYISATRSTFASTSDQIDQLESEISNLGQELQKLESSRRVLHNELQEARGNIRVFCRVRPTETPQFSLNVPRGLYRDGAEILEISDGVKQLSYPFDRVFTPETQNKAIFEEIWQLVQSSMDGYNVCVFAYGQTGSGKTHTMSHGRDGMIPLSLGRIFDKIPELASQGWQYTVSGQVLEIYNDAIVDLLVKDDTAKHDIKHDDDANTTTITNLTTTAITSAEDAHRLIEIANSNRSVGSTKMNERSSRSHSIFMIHLHGINEETGESSHGVLNLVDLAGSERLAHSQARGDRLKETQAINKSLSALGQVIGSLQKQGGHIPYRNSKLTYLLKHSLGGNSKTLMFVNISPSVANFNESANSLRFATEVNNTKLASPTKRK